MDFKEHLINSIGEKEALMLLNSLNESDKHAVILNTNKITNEQFLLEFPHVIPHPIVKNAYIYDKNEYQLGKHLYHELGYYYLQDPSAMVVSSLMGFEDDDLVLDLCAAPGGKSVQASLLMNQKGLIISNDISHSRANLISNNAERLGLRNILIVNNDFSKIDKFFQNTFDKIILDAPCSGSGMFRKSDAMKKDWSINKVYKFAEIQKELILMSYNMLKPGGLLSYSTCSYSKEEDEEVVEYLLRNSDAQVLELDIKGGYKNKDYPYGLRLMPSCFEGEGQYICHIYKQGENKITKFSNSNKDNKLLADSFKESDTKWCANSLFVLSNSFSTKYLNVIRYGVKVGEENKGIFKYDLHYAKSLKKDEMPSIELTLDEVKQYLEGNPIKKENNIKGYVLLTYMNNPVDIAKSDTHIIKNNYPKGLRRKF